MVRGADLDPATQSFAALTHDAQAVVTCRIGGVGGIGGETLAIVEHRQRQFAALLADTDTRMIGARMPHHVTQRLAGDLQQMQLLFGRQVDLAHAAIEFDTCTRDGGQVVDNYLQRLRKPTRPDTAAKRAQQLPQLRYALSTPRRNSASDSSQSRASIPSAKFA